jgi:hypothetical protein
MAMRRLVRATLAVGCVALAGAFGMARAATCRS